MIEAGEHGDRPAEVVARLSRWLSHAQDQVRDLTRVQLRHLGEHCPHDLDGQIVGTQVLQRPLTRRADRRAGGGDDPGSGTASLSSD
jgi:hypothetical protein